MKLYELKSYQDIIHTYIEFQKSLGNRITYQKLAEVMRIQKSYLSKVMSNGASLNKDQLYLFAQYIELTHDEMEYLFLLLDIEKCGIHDLKKQLQSKALEISLSKTQSNNYLNKSSLNLQTEQINEYYLSPENQLVHLALAIPKYQSDLELLKSDLRLGSSQFSKIITLLERLELIELSAKGKTKIKKSNLHLSPNSPYFESWKNQFTLKASEWNKSLNEKEKYRFTVSFTADDDTRERIRLEFLKLLKTIESEVQKAPSKNLYQMNFDLFKWI